MNRSVTPGGDRSEVRLELKARSRNLKQNWDPTRGPELEPKMGPELESKLGPKVGIKNLNLSVAQGSDKR